VEPLDPDLLERQVMNALETARRRAGLTAEEMARRLRPALRLSEVGPDKVARHNWYDWRRRPHSIPAVALVAAAELAGVSVDRLLGAGGQPDEAVAGLADLRQRVAQLEARIEGLMGAIGHRPAPSPGDDLMSWQKLLDLSRRLEVLEGEVRAAGASLARIISALDQAGLWPLAEQRKAVEKGEAETSS
jgi:hypothetical protein